MQVQKIYWIRNLAAKSPYTGVVWNTGIWTWYHQNDPDSPKLPVTNLETASNNQLVVCLLGPDAVELEVDEVGAEAALGSRQI